MTGQPFDESAERILGGAREEAARLGHEAIGAEHIVLSLLRREEPAVRLFQGLGLEPAGLGERLEAAGRKSRARTSAEPLPGAEATEGLPLTSHARRLMEVAGREARERNTAVQAAHLLLAVVSEPRGTIARLFNDASVTPAQARREALLMIDGTAPPLEPTAAPPARPADGEQQAPVASPVRAAEAAEAAEVATVDPGSAEPPKSAEPRPPRQGRERRQEARAAAAGEERPPKPPREPAEARSGAKAGERGAARETARETAREAARERRREAQVATAGAPGEGGRRAAPERGPGRERTERGERGERGEPERPAGREPTGAAVEPAPRRVLPHLEAARYSIWGPLWRRILLLAVPVSLVLGFTHQAPLLVFITSALAILPLAGLMGDATEHLSHRTGPTLGGLLNATFGNAAELIIAIAALRAGQLVLVKASITGSILGNVLLILGLSLVAASRHRPEVRFNRTAAGMSAAMMALAVVGLVFPALFHATHPVGAQRTELWMSEAVAVVLAITYVLSLVFSLRTHRNLFGSEGHTIEGPVWPVGRAVAVLALATVATAVESELLVKAVEPVTHQLGLSEIFLGLIVIPIVGNAAEHAAAVMVARKGQTDLALQIALGSSTQVALLVAPLLVLAGVVLGQRMDLVFLPFEVLALTVATTVTAIITLDGESHWFEGVQLLAVYVLIGIAAFFVTA
ncbi:MAG TPA: calcium/proton exchanger [Gemmatimonadales bacterium]|nr:calcium/proton exchanger [Gemmatimonadales bacterium]